MQLKIAICDDCGEQAEYLAELVRAWAKKVRAATDIRTFPSAEAFLFSYAEEKDYDILLLDVEMPGMSGVELAREVRRENAAVQMVFVTGYYEYFSDGFDVSALHYLIKPANADKLFPVLDRAVQNIGRGQRSVLVETAEETVRIPLAEIMYAEAENVYVCVHTKEGAYRIRQSLAKFAGQLDDTFFRVHRSYIVGLGHIRRISRTEIILTDGARIPISRGMYPAVHEALIRVL